MREYIIWGLTSDKTDKLDELPLYTNAKTKEETEKVMAILANRYGCHAMRVQVLDGSIPDFGACVAI
jgi:hypothetical protein